MEGESNAFDLWVENILVSSVLLFRETMTDFKFHEPLHCWQNMVVFKTVFSLVRVAALSRR